MENEEVLGWIRQQAGTPESAPPDVLAEAQHAGQPLATRRLETARRLAARPGIDVV